MSQLLDKLRRNLRALELGQSPRLVVGVSGGVDSAVLLDGLCRLLTERERAGLVVAHLNHQLRGEESDADEDFVSGLAAGYGLKSRVGRIAVGVLAREGGENLEAAARRLRYQFLERVATEFEAEAVVTAHTHDDQAETIIMRLLRGSGAAGLAGMRWQRPLGTTGVRLVRPLLDVSREEVVAYAREMGLQFRTDQSNFSIDYMRNRVRHELIPLLRSYNPRIEEVLVRTARLLGEDDDLLTRIARERYGEARQGESLSVAALRQVVSPVRRRILRLWLEEVRGDLRRITAGHLAAIDSILDEERSGRRIELPDGGIVSREFDRLSFDRPTIFVALPETVQLSAEMEVCFGEYRLRLWRGAEPEMPPADESPADGSGSAVSSRVWVARLRDDPALESLSVRSRAPGDALVPAGHRHRIKLKTLMIRHQIPRSRRDTWPVIVTSDDRIVWVPGIALAGAFEWRADHSTRHGCLAAWRAGKLASENG